MPMVHFAPFSTDDASEVPSEDLCPRCQAAHESAETVREIMKLLASRKSIRGNDLRTLIRAASDILHTLTYPSKERQCTCDSLN